jgi:uncharacterized membrane protein
MPALPRPPRATTLTLPPRRAELAAETDVLVGGGGPAGIGAALGAADAGAKVVLAERYGFLGGNATAALVMPLMSFHTQRAAFEAPGATRLFPSDHGPGEPVVAGALARLLHRLVRTGGAIAPSLDTGYTVPFDPEQFKLAALDLLEEAGVHFLFHAFASDVVAAGTILLAAAIVALGSVLMQRIDSHLSTEATVAWSCVFGAVVLHGISIALPTESMADATFDRGAVLPVLYLAIVASAIGYFIYFTLLDRVGAIEINLVSYAAPVFATLFGWLLLGETITVRTMLGFGAITCGFILLKHDVVLRRLGFE